MANGASPQPSGWPGLRERAAAGDGDAQGFLAAEYAEGLTPSRARFFRVGQASPLGCWPDGGPEQCSLPGILDCVVDGARGRREAIRQLADLRRKLTAAEGALAGALAAMKSAEGTFDAASDRFDAAERVLDVAREERAQARRDRYAARQAYERASVTADRLARRVRELSERLDRAAELTP